MSTRRARRQSVNTEATREVEKLPPLPEFIAYFDDYDGEHRIIENSGDDVWWMRTGGKSVRLDFRVFEEDLRFFMKHWAIWFLSWGSPGTLRAYFWSTKRFAQRHGGAALRAFLERSPMDLRSMWHTELLPMFERQWALVGMKSVLQFACAMSLGHLRPDHTEFVAGFRLPSKDKYATVRSGLVFLTMNEESALVDYFDDLNHRIRAGEAGEPSVLRDSCLLLLAYQYGFRTTQIARVREQDVRLFDVNAADGPSVHVTFETLKQRWASRRHSMVRAIKREWTRMFTAFLEHRRKEAEQYARRANLVSGSLFGLPPYEITATVALMTETVTGVRRTVNELRHTAAQRLVDAGATREELAEFMGHTSLDTGLVYFEASPTQAARINKALAISPIYSVIVEVARTRTIDKAALMRAGADHQIGGSPHGIPIAGIGACELGQSLCVKNPVMSCYGCGKFLPINDVAMHRAVLDSLRPVVRQFYDASRGETQSPAYAQLARTLAAVQEVMKAIGGDSS